MKVTGAWGSALVLATLGQVSCENKPEYNVNLVFPGQALMLATSRVQMQVLERKGSGDPCSSFMQGGAPGSQFPTVFSASPGFPFGAGDLSVQGLSFGSYAFLAEAWNKSDQRFLRGCTLAQLDRSASRVIAVQLTELRGCCRPSDPSCSSGADLPCYDGASATLGKGACKAGSAPCKVGIFTTCVGQVLPLEEACNGLDDDCDGQVDNVAADQLARDPKNCGRCGVVCPLGCTGGLCDKPADGGVDAAHDGPRADRGGDGPSTKKDAGLCKPACTGSSPVCCVNTMLGSGAKCQATAWACFCDPATGHPCGGYFPVCCEQEGNTGVCTSAVDGCACDLATGIPCGGSSPVCCSTGYGWSVCAATLDGCACNLTTGNPCTGSAPVCCNKGGSGPACAATLEGCSCDMATKQPCGGSSPLCCNNRWGSVCAATCPALDAGGPPDTAAIH